MIDCREARLRGKYKQNMADGEDDPELEVDQ